MAKVNHIERRRKTWICVTYINCRNNLENQMNFVFFSYLIQQVDFIPQR